ncbi:hypothetical protein NM208_g13804 [Fusarium decemcellulare]|uniref:Uncharacterized protein n=1 Tax=Fusarium decemcellulare TaxID=57161 RepID=A0ACC1RLX0_9HYPO|nr:hypothetical protein NM208_g13804 [Fusarium decemcellulare]
MPSPGNNETPFFIAQRYTWKDVISGQLPEYAWYHLVSFWFDPRQRLDLAYLKLCGRLLKSRLKLSSSNFQYSALSGREIRILHLLPGSAEDDVSISFSITSIDNASRNYEALSYTWGRQSCRSSQRVYVNGDVILVSCNLWEALKGLRAENEARDLWIDGLCINQDDMSERSSQVTMMGDIYRNAAGVVVWLGSATKTTARTFELMERIVAVTQSHELCSLDTYIMSQKEFLQACGLPTIQDQAWIHLDRLFWNPWYYRMWIIQEVVLAHRIVVQCGINCISWENFNRVSTFIKSKFKPPSSVNIFNSPDDTYIKISSNPLLNLNQIIEMFRQENQSMSLDRLLALSMNSVATWPVDKIYGILGLASGSVASTIVPRYDISPEHLFRSLTEQLIKTSLDILSICPQVDENFWLAILGARLVPAYPKVNVVDSGQTLVVSGLVIDTIISVGYIHLPKRRDTTKQRVIKMKGLSVGIRMNSFFMNLLLNWENLASGIVEHPTREPVASVFARTLIANLDVLGGENISCQDVYACFRDALLGHVVDHWPRAVQEAQTRYLQAFDTIAHGRCLIITSCGYMGLGPLSSSVGGKVVVFCGGKTPYVVHPLTKGSGERFRFEGEAYVYGLMDGEAFQHNPQLRDFTIV